MDEMSPETAEAMARRAHAHQKDKVGMPYFETHVQDVHRRVLAAGGDKDQQVAALLHDVLEDTDVEEADLIAQGISSGALEIVRLMTKREGDPSETYLERLRAHARARSVKLADIASNTDPVRIARLSPEMRRRVLAKHAGYLQGLTADDAHLRSALAAVPADETDDERQMRLDRVMDERMVARLEELVEESSFSTHRPSRPARGGPSEESSG